MDSFLHAGAVLPGRHGPSVAVDDEPPMTADQRTWSEILGYRRMMTYILRMAPEPGFTVDAQTLRSLHFMLMEHDLSVDPCDFVC